MMKPSTDDDTTGKVNEIKGTIKELFGKLTNNSDLAAEGRGQKKTGKLLHWVGKVETTSEE